MSRGSSVRVTSKGLWLCVSLVVLLTGTLGPSAARAQDQAPTPIHWVAKLQDAQHSLQPNLKVDLSLSAQIDSGWHIYASPQPPGSPVIPTEITIPDGQPLTVVGAIKPPPAESKMDPTIGNETTVYESSVDFIVPLKVAKKAHSGKQTLEVDVRYQACNNRMCLPPRTEKVEAAIEIAPHP